VKYTKAALPFSDQADLLIQRGLVSDRDVLIARLEAVSYYRLSAYWYTFRIPGDPGDRLTPGTSLATVWRRYTFDRQLRLLVMDAIERIEVAIRSQMVNLHTLQYGPFGYLDRASLPEITVEYHRELLDKIRDEAEHSREDFVRHYHRKYTMEHDLPLWMACELMTFGMMFTLMRGMKTPDKQRLADKYGVADAVLDSWLAAINQVRNLCAHHARLWNRIFGITPAIPRINKHPQWHTPVKIPNDKLFGILTVLHYLLRQVAPQSHWKDRFVRLLADYPDIPIRFMGFPANWQDSPLWSGPTTGGGAKP
jgi:abortive infection bacteriophage resistance protein